MYREPGFMQVHWGLTFQETSSVSLNVLLYACIWFFVVSSSSWHIISCTYLPCTFYKYWHCVQHANITATKIMTTSFTPECFLLFLCNSAPTPSLFPPCTQAMRVCCVWIRQALLIVLSCTPKRECSSICFCVHLWWYLEVPCDWLCKYSCYTGSAHLSSPTSQISFLSPLREWGGR